MSTIVSTTDDDVLGGLEVLRIVQVALIENYAVHEYNRTLKLFTMNKKHKLSTIFVKNVKLEGLVSEIQWSNQSGKDAQAIYLEIEEWF